ncbi:amidase [Acuticoccus sp. MNP-M23]|uniref:amidase n=1 Tax=Acuticoccus sp. MNP-M23 TaxID=3072793 RepID=UPI002814FE38|nr:amidase [Acuticoccus sp. MNP-M23]WMS42450.1 amidase [Acuticoccus sp. MNP-M23]
MPELTPDAAADLSVAALARAYRLGEADPVAVTEVCLSRIAQASGASVFLAVTEDRARREAEASRARYAAGRPASPVDGVPVAWKDLFDMEGEVTTAGSALLRHAPPAEADAPVVAQLSAAGMVAVGKTNLTEFAFSALGLNPHYGTCANPWDSETPRCPGGSSSGSAVAVAAGLVPVAIGSDTGGSVRVPAAFNGLVGAKSSEGRISTRGAYPLSYTLDTVGPLCRTVEDAVLTDAALRGTSPTVTRGNLSDLKLVVAEGLPMDDCDEVVLTAFEAAVERLAKAGATIERHEFAELAEASQMLATHGTIANAEAYHFHKERVDGPDVEEIDGRVAARILRGKTMSADDLLELQIGRRRLAASLASTLNGALLIYPTVAHIAPEIAPLDADPALFNDVNMRSLRNTMVGNFLNLPGVALPAASPSPMPVSLLVSGLANTDETVLSAAWAMENMVRGG